MACVKDVLSFINVVSKDSIAMCARSCQEPKYKWIVSLFPQTLRLFELIFVTPVSIIKSIEIFIGFYVAQKSTKIDKICG